MEHADDREPVAVGVAGVDLDAVGRIGPVLRNAHQVNVAGDRQRANDVDGKPPVRRDELGGRDL